MTRPTENLPLQLYIQDLKITGIDDETAEGTEVSYFEVNDLVASKLRLSYQNLWCILASIAAKSSQASRERFTSKYFFEAQAVPGHPDVLLRCQLLDDRWLTLVLEQTIQEPTFVGRTGLILGARGSGKMPALRGQHARTVLELDLADTARSHSVPRSPHQQHADELLSWLVFEPKEVTRIQEWFENTEKVVTVPEQSLREATQWLSAVNQEIAREREVAHARALSQNDAFMKLYMSLADSRTGA